MRAQLLCLTLFSAASGLWAAIPVVTPSGWDNTAAPTYAAQPFAIGDETMRYQQVCDPRAFPTFGQTVHAYWISGMVFRTEEDAFGVYDADIDFQVNLSTTTRGPDALSTVFAENVGLDDTMVFPRQTMIIGAAPGHVSQIINFTQPFYYDSQTGNVLLDVRYFGVGAFGQFIPLDAVNDPNDDVSRLWANSVDATSGTADSLGLVLGFYVTPIPEPSTITLLFCGLAVLGFALRRQTHRTK